MERTLKRHAPYWVECENLDCDGGNVVQTTFPDCPKEHVYDGDDFECKGCGVIGTGWVGEDDGDYGVDWNEDGP